MKIKYSDFETFSCKYTEELKEYTKWIEKYLGYIDDICEEGIISGRAHTELLKFRNEFAKIKDMPETIANSVNKIISEYIDDLDNAQKINGVSVLYDRNYKGYMDYSQKYFYELRNVAEETNDGGDIFSTLFLNFLDFLEDLYYWANKLKGMYDNSKEKDIRKTQEALLQYNDVTVRQLRNIERNLNDVDQKCYNRLQKVEDSIKKMYNYIEVFKKIMEQYQDIPSSFDISKFDFESKYFEMIQAFNNVNSIGNVTDEDVEDFISSDGCEQFLDEQYNIIKDYTYEVSQIDMMDVKFWEIIIFQWFDIAEGKIKNVGDYEKYLMKKEIMDMIDDLAGNYVYSGSGEQEIIDEFKSLYNEAKKKGQSTYDFLNKIRDENGKVLDGRTKKAREFRKFLKSLKNAERILEFGDQGINIISKLFINYDKNLEFLDSFERNVNISDDTMKECIAEIRATYEHELSQTLNDIALQCTNNAVDYIYEINIPVIDVIGKIKKTIGFVGEISGESAKTAAQIEFYNSARPIIDNAERAFKESLRKLKEADKDAEDYDILMNDFKNSFGFYKNTLSRWLNKMAIASDSPKRDYYYYCSSKVSSMELKDVSNPDFMSYEEYLKEGYTDVDNLLLQ